MRKRQGMPWQYQMLGIPVEGSHWELAEGDLKSGWWQRILRRVQNNGPTQTWLKAAGSRGWRKDLKGSLLVCVSQNTTLVFKTNTLLCQRGDSRPLMNKELLSLIELRFARIALANLPLARKRLLSASGEKGDLVRPSPVKVSTASYWPVGVLGVC